MCVCIYIYIYIVSHRENGPPYFCTQCTDVGYIQWTRPRHRTQYRPVLSSGRCPVTTVTAKMRPSSHLVVLPIEGSMPRRGN